MVFALLAAFAVRVAAVFVLAFHCNGRSGAVIQQRAAWRSHLPGFKETFGQEFCSFRGAM